MVREPRWVVWSRFPAVALLGYAVGFTRDKGRLIAVHFFFFSIELHLPPKA